VGFKRQPKVYRLVFDQPDLAGLVVKARSLSIGEIEDDDAKVYEQFAAALVEWNLEGEDGQVQPLTLESVMGYPDYELISLMATTWLEAVTGVKEELGKDSSSGQPFPEGSIPMETLSQSQAS
jgi:hypothetical protein